LVVGNPANTNCLIVSHFAPNIPKENFTALTRLDQNRAESQIAERVGTHHRKVRNLIIWGNHSATQVPDAQVGIILDYPQKGIVTPVKSAVCDDKWISS
jgi:malate dehydrogenase